MRKFCVLWDVQFCFWFSVVFNSQGCGLSILDTLHFSLHTFKYVIYFSRFENYEIMSSLQLSFSVHFDVFKSPSMKQSYVNELTCLIVSHFWDPEFEVKVRGCELTVGCHRFINRKTQREDPNHHVLPKNMSSRETVHVHLTEIFTINIHCTPSQK